MKTIFLALCLFLFAYKASSSVIIDTDGNPVRNAGGAYYLEPVFHGKGGLGLAKVGNEEEPTAVVLDPESSPGLPVRFESPLRILYTTEHMALNINFVSSESGVWGVTPEFPIGGAVRVSDQKTLFGPFRVQKAEGGYKIVYYYHGQGVIGQDIGLVPVEEGKYRLALTLGEPFIFKIRNAVSDESSAGIKSIV